MHSIDRVRKTLAHVRPDRPPADGTFCSQVWQALRAHLSPHDDDQIMDALGFDFRRAVLEPSNEFAATAVPAPVEVSVGAGTRNLVRLLPNGPMSCNTTCHGRICKRSMTKSLGPQRKD